MAQTLWYDSPATKWQQGLPFGNGRIGAVVLSDTNSESWSFNEITFWSGRPEESPKVYGGKSAIHDMQAHYHRGDYVGGKALAEKFLEPPKHNFGTNLTVANISLIFDEQTEAKPDSFRRELNLDDAISTAQYTFAGHTYSRETFVSHPQQVLVSKITTDAPQGLSFALSISSDNPDFKVNTVDGAIEFEAHALESIHSDGTCGVEGRGTIKISTSGGSLQSNNGKLEVKNASSVLIFVAFNTNFRQSDDSWATLSTKQIRDAESLSYQQLKEAHIKDYQALYRRVSIDLGRSSNEGLPVDQRQAKFNKASNFNDPGLFALYFQYARYLTIAGTRSDSPLPLHLQGLWNDGEANRMNWSCDYHLDINTQMNYWPTEISNLLECNIPLMEYTARLSNAGQTTAKEFYGSPGWVAHVFSNVWGFTDPGWETSWGLNVTGGLWIATHMMQHYEYTLDQKFLNEQAIPVLKSCAEFFLDYMTIQADTGYLVTGPSVSPENSFFTGNPKDGEQQLSLGPTLDIILIRDLFDFLVKTASQSNLDSELTTRIKDALPKLPPLKIGKRGQLQEWLLDYEEAQPDHRHLSHTMALCRSTQISARHTPALAEAVRVTLANRQARADLEDIEFTAALFGANFARLNDAESAFKQIGHLIGELSFENLLSYSKPGIAGAETNIFVIDGNFGGAGVIGEMLLRSAGEGEIDLLPALPKQWGTGSVAGLRARGNLEVDVEWKDGGLTGAKLKAFSPGSVTLYYNELKADVSFKAGDIWKFNGLLEIV
ncbi:putative alpha-L-fucosidase 2 precursor [Xylogone sp. PMI_703]|nr:putative alpha-L-fucosidase 2 precursor [Xylogone sp. PMI_703]